MYIQLKKTSKDQHLVSLTFFIEVHIEACQFSECKHVVNL